MEFVLLPLVACIASLLTFFSGFGLGTILTPIFVLYFPIEVAITMTAIVHLLNNLFKFALVGRHTDKSVLVKFGIPAIIAALFGAWLLTKISFLPPIARYEWQGGTFFILPVKVIIAALIILFTLFELIPRLRDMKVHPKFLPLGGVLSGFFGGLSGHQGALRSAFLARSGLTKESFIATGVAIACLIDLSRITVYFKRINFALLSDHLTLLAITTAAAFIGAFAGSKLLTKVTMRGIQVLVSVSLFVLAVGLGLGLI